MHAYSEMHPEFKARGAYSKACGDTLATLISLPVTAARFDTGQAFGVINNYKEVIFSTAVQRKEKKLDKPNTQ